MVKGIPHRTARTIARAHGAKVPPLPAEGDYCAIHGNTHNGQACKAENHDAAAMQISREGGNDKL